jgi:fucose permease
MLLSARNSSGQAIAVLHPAFALTGVLQAVNGALLPSLASTFHMNDSDSGFLFLLYFAGTSVGALFCRVNYARTMALGFLAMSACCVGVALANRPLLPLIFLLLGVSVSVPMSAVSLFVGRSFARRVAPMLTLLNFSWSIGAMAAPLLAAQLLRHHTYRTAYLVLALAAVLASAACHLLLQDAHEEERQLQSARGFSNLHLIAIFALAAFLQVGVENTAAAWMATFALRLGAGTVAFAAISCSLYWCGFLASRGLSSLVMMRVDPMRVFAIAVGVALFAAALLIAAPSANVRGLGMFLLGGALAPIYPLLIAGFFARARHTSDLRWVLATAGFGGSVLPWLAGWISTHAGALRLGMLTIPGALLIMAFVLPALRGPRPSVT